MQYKQKLCKNLRANMCPANIDPAKVQKEEHGHHRSSSDSVHLVGIVDPRAALCSNTVDPSVSYYYKKSLVRYTPDKMNDPKCSKESTPYEIFGDETSTKEEKFALRNNYVRCFQRKDGLMNCNLGVAWASSTNLAKAKGYQWRNETKKWIELGISIYADNRHYQFKEGGRQGEALTEYLLTSLLWVGGRKIKNKSGYHQFDNSVYSKSLKVYGEEYDKKIRSLIQEHWYKTGPAKVAEVIGDLFEWAVLCFLAQQNKKAIVALTIEHGQMAYGQEVMTFIDIAIQKQQQESAAQQCKPAIVELRNS